MDDVWGPFGFGSCTCRRSAPVEFSFDLSQRTKSYSPNHLDFTWSSVYKSCIVMNQHHTVSAEQERLFVEYLYWVKGWPKTAFARGVPGPGVCHDPVAGLPRCSGSSGQPQCGACHSSQAYVLLWAASFVSREWHKHYPVLPVPRCRRIWGALNPLYCWQFWILCFCSLLKVCPMSLLNFSLRRHHSLFLQKKFMSKAWICVRS